MSFDFSPLCDLSARVVLFPVRHHSPTAARLVAGLIRSLRPGAVLIECASDYNGRLDELALPHTPPIALYSFVRMADGTRKGAFYPFCEHSPEWQAARVGRDIGAEVRFIDLPWADIAASDAEEASNRFSDASFLRSRYIRSLCKKLGVDDFHALWDTLFEIDPSIDAQTYLVRCHALCGHMRQLEGPGSLCDRRREAHMAAEIREAMTRHAAPILVVVGGAHCLPIHARLVGLPLGELVEPAEYARLPVPDGEERGVALTPYSFERLDGLTGYDAGMPNPGFYQQLWEDRRARRDTTHRTLLARVVETLRRRKQLVSSADLIATESTAQALAALRGHACIWRTDLVDALTTSLVKEDLSRAGRHPLLDAVHEVLRGGARGLLAEGTQLPPLVLDIQARLREYDLEATGQPREVEFILENAADRPPSQVLHRLRLLEIAGYTRSGGTDFATRDEMVTIWERWRIAWSPDFDAKCIEAARYGASLAEAAAAILGERVEETERDAGAAAELLLDAALAGLTGLAWAMRQRVEDRIRAEGDFFNLTGALGHLLYLYRYDTVLRTAGDESMGRLLQEAYTRALWLLEGLRQTGGRDREAVGAVAAVRETFERCELTLGLSRDDLVNVLARVGGDHGQAPMVRGAALGATWSLGATAVADIRVQLGQFTDPDRLGDFLAGLFALAREQVQRQRDLVLAIHATLDGWSDDDFLRALPALRLAFTYFTPREKHHLALSLRESLGLDPRPEPVRLEVDVQTAARALALEGRLFDAAKRFGLREGLLPSPPVLRGGGVGGEGEDRRPQTPSPLTPLPLSTGGEGDQQRGSNP